MNASPAELLTATQDVVVSDFEATMIPGRRPEYEESSIVLCGSFDRNIEA